jgi:hypothetical protein
VDVGEEFHLRVVTGVGRPDGGLQLVSAGVVDVLEVSVFPQVPHGVLSAGGLGVVGHAEQAAGVGVPFEVSVHLGR